MLPCTAGHQGQNSGRSSDVLYCQDIKIIRSSDVVLYSWSESRQVTTFCPVLPGRQGQNLGRSPHVSLYCQGVKVRIQAGHHMLPCIARTSRSRSEFRQVTTCCPVLPGRQDQNSGRSSDFVFCSRSEFRQVITCCPALQAFVRPQGVWW